MRILQVAASLAGRYGGPPFAVEEMSTQLASRGHQVEVLSTDFGLPHRVSHTTVEQRDGVRYTVTPTRWLERYVFSFPLLRELSARLPQATVVHIHSLYLFHTLAAGTLARARGIPYVVSPHGALNEYHWSRSRWRKTPYEVLFERRVFGGAALIHCCSERERAFAMKRRLIRGVPCEVVPLGVRMPPIRENGGGSAEDRPSLLFLGRVTAKKRVDLVARAFLCVASRFPSATLTVAGPDDEGIAARLREELSGEEGYERIRWVGVVNREEKASLLRSAQAFLLPSEDESFGVAVVEAMAAGVPVVVSKEVGISGEIEHSGAGLIVERNVSSIATALERLLDDVMLGKALGDAGTAVANHRFSLDAMGERLESLYLRTI